MLNSTIFVHRRFRNFNFRSVITFLSLFGLLIQLAGRSGSPARANVPMPYSGNSLCDSCRWTCTKTESPEGPSLSRYHWGRGWALGLAWHCSCAAQQTPLPPAAAAPFLSPLLSCCCSSRNIGIKKCRCALSN